MKYLIFDIGGSSIKYAVGDQNGSLSDKGKTECSGENLQEFMEYIKNVYETVEHTHNLVGIAISSPGFVDTANGIVHGISALPFIHNFPLASLISKAMGNLPVSIENDGNCGALGEYWKGGWGEVKNLVMLVCGSGIGGGSVYQGEILPTSHYSASEFGFMPIGHENGRVLPWSQYSVVNITNRYNKNNQCSISSKELFDRPKEDEIAYGYTEEFYHYLAVGSLCTAFALDPEVIVISGAISGREDFKERLYRKVESLKRECKEYAQLPSEIVVSSLGNDANLYGALYHALKQNGQKCVLRS